MDVSHLVTSLMNFTAQTATVDHPIFEASGHALGTVMVSKLVHLVLHHPGRIGDVNPILIDVVIVAASYCGHN